MPCILTINGGSSSIRFAVYEANETLRRRLDGKIDRIGVSGTNLAARFQRMVNHESCLLGVSGTSSDVRDLLAQEATDVQAAEAVALFCYRVKQWIGSFAAVLGGLDTLVFTAGIGENAPRIRARICDGLGFLGIRLSPTRNARNAPVISPGASRVTVRVIRTNEERVIARSVIGVLHLDSTSAHVGEYHP
ncbi:MAG TPA: hypothetical protein VNU46_08490 [Gemmatimonadaceae bacterium]|nr:hypothetical protein [Gemmatimonadaceae bacterium]